ncbi:hypothetical protein I2I05_11605 [Hymenobacter sp. BT683]|uniref:Uncharacterized protein n=1 Tax=Hymenobacter jeongseonensis TaxID=2791027 RepID=A0ABS0IJT8_9BACT|nr:hypothetical protein [Hymenobacter jeongseonensis]MBF9238040.1 hypothetical protein [Hymenobacter jeongseonensis]
MQTQRWLPWVLAVSLAGCETRRPVEEAGQPSRQVPVVSQLPTDTSGRARRPLPPALPLDTEAAEPWTRLQTALRRHDTAQLNQLIDPALGLWVVEDGATGLVITRVAAGAAFRQAYARVPLQSVERQLQPCSALLAVPQFPDIDCGERRNGRSGYERDGCFGGPATDFKALDLWSRTRLKDGTLAQGQAAQARVGRTVLHTRSGFRFHFAKRPGNAGRWYLVFVDLRTPCIS